MNFWQGEAVKLRAVEPSDADYFYSWQHDSERTRFLDLLPPPSSRAAHTLWAEERSKREMKDDTFQWMVETLDGEVVGSIATHSCNPRVGTFSYGLDIEAAQRRKGYASETINLILAYYFEEMRYQKVTVAVQSNNAASIKLHQHLGFVAEGTQRRMVYTQGTFFDLVWFGMTSEEFQEKIFAKEERVDETF